MRASIYIPNKHWSIRNALCHSLTNAVGGCSLQHITGYWKDKNGNVQMEPTDLVWVDVLGDTQTQRITDIFADVVDMLHDAGEEAVLLEETSNIVAYMLKPNHEEVA